MTNSIALVIPTFNAAATLPETLRSVMAQPQAEKSLSRVILADDGSDDETIALAQAQWDSSIPLHILQHTQHIGQFANLNAALEMLAPETEWVLVLHADDVAKPTWLDEMQIRMQLCTPEIASICASWDNWYPDNSIEPGEDGASENVRVIPGTRENVRGTLLRGCWWHISGCALRTKAFREIGPFRRDLNQMSDWEWLLRCLAKGGGVEYIPCALILYRQHAQSVSSASFRINRDINESLDIMQTYADYLPAAERRAFLQTRAGWTFKRLGKAMLYGQFGQLKPTYATLKAIWAVYRTAAK